MRTVITRRPRGGVRRFSFKPADVFVNRHLGPSPKEVEEMLKTVGCASVAELMGQVLPKSVLRELPLDIPALTESAALAKLEEILGANAPAKCFLGQGYHGTKVPSAIVTGILNNPGWYTAYTPYQAEISQGRMESLFNYQSGICELTGMECANASLLDEGTSAAEAVQMAMRLRRAKGTARVMIDAACHPQTIDIVKDRAANFDVEVIVASLDEMTISDSHDLVCVLVQYPGTDGIARDFSALAEKVHSKKGYVIAACDPLALTLMKTPASMGADIAVGTSQRFGVPMWYGGPHASFFATKKQYIRNMPGRIIGASKDRHDKMGFRLTLQTREQHIRQDKATSNICTAQALLANMAGMYMCYHGPEGLRQIAGQVKLLQQQTTNAVRASGFEAVTGDNAFDTVTVNVAPMNTTWLQNAFLERDLAIRVVDENHISFSFDETHTERDAAELVEVLRMAARMASEDVLTFPLVQPPKSGEVPETGAMPAAWARANGPDGKPDFLTSKCFHSHQSETQIMRYMKQLENKDLSLVHSMITLGSCTMKLNSASSLVPVGWSSIADVHPFMAAGRVQGLKALMNDLERHLNHVTAMDATSLQPCSGASGEYAGLMAIKGYHEARGGHARDVCIVPKSAHGTNPASAAVAGMKVVWVDDSDGMDLNVLKETCEKYKDTLSAIMVTYPSTRGIFEENIVEICEMIHSYGGQVYMDGANMNAQLGQTAPGAIGADVCHLNLHKTFSIPHGGGGPGLGPICMKAHLAKYAPGHRALGLESPEGGCQSAAPYGQAGIAAIPWMFTVMLGSSGLRQSSELAILNANYMMERLKPYYKSVSLGRKGRCSHEFVLDMNDIRASTGITEADFAKRLSDYGFHAPTMSWPVPRSLMIEPTESEDKGELDRFCDAFISMHAEVKRVESGEWPKDNNPLVNAPHTQDMVCANEWKYPYTRDEAAFPLAFVREKKFWPTVARVDDAYGDKVLQTTWRDVAK
jgi:glycine dehydrogenase